jgi:hypothetical protein
MKKVSLLIAMAACIIGMNGCKKSGASIHVKATKYTNCATSTGVIISANGATIKLQTAGAGATVDSKTASSDGEVVFDGIEAGDYDVYGFTEASACTQQGTQRIHVSEDESKEVDLFLD